MTSTSPRWRRLLLRLAGLSLGFLLVAVLAHEHVCRFAAPHIVAAAAAPQVDLLIVPGARIHADGTPFGILADRLAAARDLFAAGRAPRILVSGEGAGPIGNNEVAAMRRWLEGHGVPAAAIVDDPLGLRTLDTMYRAKDVFAARSAIVVSNPFHVDRCVFLGREHGLDVVGVAAPYTSHPASTMLRNRGREIAARVFAWLEVFVLRTPAVDSR